MENKDFLIDPSEILNLMHFNAENSFSHTTYRKELERFFYLAQGDERAIECSDQILQSDIQGKLSEDPLRNYKYLFIVNTGLATRFVIEAGVPQELTYSLSDVYIRKADVAKSEEEIRELNRELWKRLVEIVQDLHNDEPYSRPVKQCIDYMTSHFNTRIALKDLSSLTGLTPNYLASLFKRETGMTIGEYLAKFRVDSACALLTGTDYSYLQIALSLGFCSQSYFVKVFKSKTGFTPKAFRLKNSERAFS